MMGFDLCHASLRWDKERGQLPHEHFVGFLSTKAHQILVHGYLHISAWRKGRKPHEEKENWCSPALVWGMRTHWDILQSVGCKLNDCVRSSTKSIHSLVACRHYMSCGASVEWNQSMWSSSSGCLNRKACWGLPKKDSSNSMQPQHRCWWDIGFGKNCFLDQCLTLLLHMGFSLPCYYGLLLFEWLCIVLCWNYHEQATQQVEGGYCWGVANPQVLLSP